MSVPELNRGENLSWGGFCRDTLIPKTPGAGRTFPCAAKAASPVPEQAEPSVHQHPEGPELRADADGAGSGAVFSALGPSREGAGGGRGAAGTEPPTAGGAVHGGEMLPTGNGLRNSGVICAISLCFSFTIQGAPSSAVKISGVRWWLTRGRMQAVLWLCPAAGEGGESTVIFLIQT